MKRGYKRTKTLMRNYQLTKGTSIEENMRLVTATNEVVENVRPLTYTERSQGVLPQYDIRTDKWDLAMEAAGKMAKSAIANGNNNEMIAYAKENNLPYNITEVEENNEN